MFLNTDTTKHKKNILSFVEISMFVQFATSITGVSVDHQVKKCCCSSLIGDLFFTRHFDPGGIFQKN